MQNAKILCSGFILLCILFLFSCKKDKDNSPDEDRGGGEGVIDIDGNNYKTVKIGTKVWMTENLKTTKYNDGTSIPNELSSADWSTTTTGAYAIYGDNADNDATYGKLYNWYAVNTRKLAPKGWHVPTRDEWETMISFLGGLDVAGGKMKATTGWSSPNVGADNSSGFSGLPGGYRYQRNGVYDEKDWWGYFWSSTEEDANSARLYGMYYNSASITLGYTNKKNGYSVRCVKD